MHYWSKHSTPCRMARTNTADSACIKHFYFNTAAKCQITMPSACFLNGWSTSSFRIPYSPPSPPNTDAIFFPASPPPTMKPAASSSTTSKTPMPASEPAPPSSTPKKPPHPAPMKKKSKPSSCTPLTLTPRSTSKCLPPRLRSTSIPRQRRAWRSLLRARSSMAFRRA